MASHGHTCIRKAGQCQRWFDKDQILMPVVGDNRKLAWDSHSKRTGYHRASLSLVNQKVKLCRTRQLASSAGH